MAHLSGKEPSQFGYSSAGEILTAVETNSFTGNITRKSPVNYLSGDVYVIRLTNPKDTDWKADIRGWRDIGTVKSKNSGVQKTTYDVIIGEKLKRSNAFRRFAYRLIRPIDSERPAVILHYYGDATIGQERPPHGNAKPGSYELRPFIAVAKSTITALQEQLQTGSRPQRAYDNVQMNLEEDAHRHGENYVEHEPVVAPRNLKMVQNVKYKMDKEKRISDDDMYNLVLLSRTELHDFVKFVEAAPDVLVVCYDNNGVTLANQLLLCSSNNHALQQLVSYDTTFKLGDFYLSVITMRNTHFVNDPIFPVMFMLHSRKYEWMHEFFWRYHVAKELNLTASGANVPITTDREQALVNAIMTHMPAGRLVFCHIHLIKDVKSWINRNKGERADYRGYIKHIRELMECETEEQFDNKYDVLRQTWTRKFVAYADKNLRSDLRNHAIAARTKRFAAFQKKVATNNISESLNKMLKERNNWKELPIDGMVMSLFLMQQSLFHEFNRGYRGLGNYHLKDNVRNADELQLYGVMFIPIEQIVSKVKGDIQKRPPPPIRSGHQLSKAFLARACLDRDYVKFERGLSVYIVHSPITSECHVVKLGRNATCSCKFKQCYHVLAVDMFRGVDKQPSVTTAKLSDLTKSRKPEGKSGRRKPRTKDTDLVVIEAPDSMLASTSVCIRHSTPQHSSLEDRDDAAAILESLSPVYSIDSTTDAHTDNTSDFSPVMVTEDIDIAAENCSLNGSPTHEEHEVDIIPRRPSPPPTAEERRQNVCLYGLEAVSKLSLSVAESQLSNQQTYKCLHLQQELDNWICDDFTICLIRALHWEKSVVRVTSHEFSAMRLGNYLPVLRRLAHMEALNKDVMYVVILTDIDRGVHFIAGIVHFALRQVYLLDSANFKTVAKDIMQELAKLVVLSYVAAGAKCDLHKWKFIYSTDCPKQLECSNDCGVFVSGYYLLGILAREKTCVAPSVLGRLWIHHILSTSPFGTDENIPATITPRMLEKVAKARDAISMADIAGVKVRYQNTESQTMEILSDENTGWSMCHFGDKCIGTHSGTQVLCFFCHKWMHKECEGVNTCGEEYYTCKACHGKSST